MRLIDAELLEEDIRDYLYDDDELECSKQREYDRGYNNGLKCAIRCIKLHATTIDAVPVVHYKDTNTTVLNVKSIEDWQNRIILDEGEESRSSAVYYADSDDMVRVVRCKDCERRGGDFCPMRREEYCGYGFELSDLTKDDSYCSYGTVKDKKEATK